jgi:hypothetical protein
MSSSNLCHLSLSRQKARALSDPVLAARLPPIAGSGVRSYSPLCDVVKSITQGFAG